MGKKTNLKATLSKFQEQQRRTQVQKAKDSAKKDILKRSKPSAKSKGKRPTTHFNHLNSSTIPFTSSDTVLLIGEGNFSFARALFDSGHETLSHFPPSNVTATTYDSEDACYEKYPDAREIVEELRGKGVMVVFGVDARRLEGCKELKKRKWQRIVWNFPHAGKGISDQDRNVLENQLLILDFLKSAGPFLRDGAVPSMISRNPWRTRRAAVNSDEDDTPGLHPGEGRVGDPEISERGTILITLRNSPPYTLWDVPRLAKKPPLPHVSSVLPSIPNRRYIQLRSFAFKQSDWKGYEHRMTKGWVEGVVRGGDSVPPDKVEDRTWEFYLADESSNDDDF